MQRRRKREFSGAAMEGPWQHGVRPWTASNPKAYPPPIPPARARGFRCPSSQARFRLASQPSRSAVITDYSTILTLHSIQAPQYYPSCFFPESPSEGECALRPRPLPPSTHQATHHKVLARPVIHRASLSRDVGRSPLLGLGAVPACHAMSPVPQRGSALSSANAPPPSDPV